MLQQVNKTLEQSLAYNKALVALAKEVQQKKEHIPEPEPEPEPEPKGNATKKLFLSILK